MQIGWKDSALHDAVKTIAEALHTDNMECKKEGSTSTEGAGGVEQDAPSQPKMVLDIAGVSFSGLTVSFINILLLLWTHIIVAITRLAICVIYSLREMFSLKKMAVGVELLLW